MATYCLEDPATRDLSCPICFEDYDIHDPKHYPKLLLCLHTFCATCTKMLLRPDKSLECSMCRMLHTGVKLEDLYDNHVIFTHLRQKCEERDLELAMRIDREMRNATGECPTLTPSMELFTTPNPATAPVPAPLQLQATPELVVLNSSLDQSSLIADDDIESCLEQSNVTEHDNSVEEEVDDEIERISITMSDPSVNRAGNMWGSIPWQNETTDEEDGIEPDDELVDEEREIDTDDTSEGENLDEGNEGDDSDGIEDMQCMRSLQLLVDIFETHNNDIDASFEDEVEEEEVEVDDFDDVDVDDVNNVLEEEAHHEEAEDEWQSASEDCTPNNHWNLNFSDDSEDVDDVNDVLQWSVLTPEAITED